jgi:hypothetical protein
LRSICGSLACKFVLVLLSIQQTVDKIQDSSWSEPSAHWYDCCFVEVDVEKD